MSSSETASSEPRRSGGSDFRVILGVWDGHDSGAAVIVDGALVAAVNEERFTRRKLEIRFPAAAITCALRIAGLQPADVDLVAISTSDLAKTLTRWAPQLKEQYYRVRRRLAAPGLLASWTRAAKYRLTEFGPTRATRALSTLAVTRDLRRLGIPTRDLRLYDHHVCHATSAALSSGMASCAVLTIDGLGDGMSCTVSRFDRGMLTRVAATPASHSLGVFFEHVTNLLNMRELEDEGKVMALADYAAPVPDADNPMLQLVWADGLQIRTAGASRELRASLKRLLWRYPNEQFASMAQRAVERAVSGLADEACRAVGVRQLALTGGVAANVKANRRVRLLERVDDLFVFPHVGDGGLAVGAACAALADVSAAQGRAVPRLDLDSLALGPDFSEVEMERALGAAGLRYSRPQAMSEQAADLLVADKILCWFDGRMEFGPRALGHRSVIARPDRTALRDRLNLVLKRRVWYQPFCPSILDDDARRGFADWKGDPNRHMTMTYAVCPQMRAALAGVLSVDHSCRPQIVREDATGALADVLRALRQRLGVGAVLNTSLNVHGEPIVCTPTEAVDVFIRSGADALRLGPFLTVRPPADA